MRETAHIASCGINCVVCYAYQREKKRCPGCNGAAELKPQHCRTCAIAGCEYHNGGGRLCNECTTGFPCARLRRLDKRYREKYGTSMVDNLRDIAQTGREAFTLAEREKWRCPSCGAVLCVHKAECPGCGGRNPHFPENRKG